MWLKWQRWIKEVADRLVAGIVLLVGLPVLLLVALAIRLESPGPIIFRQQRVGRHNRDFTLLKFRSMTIGSDRASAITIGNTDSRITKVGQFIRRFKIDELPQLWNVLRGDMSLVGPRPEVRKYVDLYSTEQLAVLAVKPGITDPASIAYRNENELLGRVPYPQSYYIEVILPDKLRISLEYISKWSLAGDAIVIFKTVVAIFR